MSALSLNASQPLARWIPLALVAAALLVNPLAGMLSGLLWPDGGGLRWGDYVSLSLYAYVFCTVFAAPPLLLFACVMALARRAAEARPALRAALRVGAVVFPLLSFLAQLFAWKDGGIDSEAAWLFAILSIYAAIGSLLLTGLTFLFRLVFKR